MKKYAILIKYIMWIFKLWVKDGFTITVKNSNIKIKLKITLIKKPNTNTNISVIHTA